MITIAARGLALRTELCALLVEAMELKAGEKGYTALAFFQPQTEVPPDAE